MNRIMLAALAAAGVLIAGAGRAQQPTTPPVGPDWSKVELTTTDLGRGTYLLAGSGVNTTVALADDGVIIVDGQYAPLNAKTKAAIEALSKQPVRFLVNTHHHSDHSGGNEGFAKDGVTIVAHVNARNRLAAGTTHNITGARTPPVPDAALPARTHTDGTSLELKGRTAQLKYAPGAHTDGDTYVYFAEANVLATGDTMTLGRYPNIDFLNGGNIKGMIEAADTYLAAGRNWIRVVYVSLKGL